MGRELLRKGYFSNGKLGIFAVIAISLTLFGGGFVRAADNIDELYKNAVFSFAIISDNHTSSPYTSLPFAKMDLWAKAYGYRFIIGDGDHVKDPGDPFIPFIHNDPFWHANFYPGAGDHGNEYYGSGEDDWGAGGALFNEVDLASRPWVQIRPNGCEYYAQIPVDDWTVHLIHVHYPDEPPDPSIAFPEDSRQYLIDAFIPTPAGGYGKMRFGNRGIYPLL